MIIFIIDSVLDSLFSKKLLIKVEDEVLKSQSFQFTVTEENQKLFTVTFVQ